MTKVTPQTLWKGKSVMYFKYDSIRGFFPTKKCVVIEETEKEVVIEYKTKFLFFTKTERIFCFKYDECMVSWAPEKTGYAKLLL